MRSHLVPALALAAVIVLAGASFASAHSVDAATAPQYCRDCHPVAHPAAWPRVHGAQITSDPASYRTCERCHTPADCDSCHPGQY